MITLCFAMNMLFREIPMRSHWATQDTKTPRHKRLHRFVMKLMPSCCQVLDGKPLSPALTVSRVHLSARREATVVGVTAEATAVVTDRAETEEVEHRR